jgi:2-oxo-4-hydroxy-4-carboxy-5-ureidoimidazoline decarboxylase
MTGAPVRRLSLESLNAADEAGLIAGLGDIYEHAPWVAQAAAARRPFATLADLHAAMIGAVRAAPAEQRLALIRAHPDLAGKAARAGTLTPQSGAEQASAGLDRLPEAQLAQLQQLAGAYREKFAMPFIICVRRHSRDSILAQLERRLHNDTATEANAALDEIFRIAALRLDDRVQAADALPVHGRLSTHVLDTHAGQPAAGMEIELVELSAGGGRRGIARATTNRDGRTERPLIGGCPLPIGRYQLQFHVGDYFAARGTAQGDPRFLDIVPVEFALAEPEGNYHVPLLVTPWSYCTYRGS